MRKTISSIQLTERNRSAITQKTFDFVNFLSELDVEENEGLAALVRNSPFSIIEMVDDNGSTLLHNAVLKCVPGKVEALIGLAKKVQNATDQQIKGWVNSRTNGEQFSPLHLASFKENMDAIRSLIAHGSDI